MGEMVIKRDAHGIYYMEEIPDEDEAQVEAVVQVAESKPEVVQELMATPVEEESIEMANAFDIKWPKVKKPKVAKKKTVKKPRRLRTKMA